MKNGMTVVFLVLIMSVLCGCRDTGNEVLWVNEQEISGDEVLDGEQEETTREALSQPDTQPLICVDVCGAVEHPGVYFLEEGARVYEAVQMAGGLTPDADVNRINQAEALQDGAKVRIYTTEEAEALQESEAASGLVNLNTADEELLCTLSGIGEARAKDIIAYRKEHGAFRTVEEIMNVSGIKEATFEKIKDKIVAE